MAEHATIGLRHFPVDVDRDGSETLGWTVHHYRAGEMAEDLNEDAPTVFLIELVRELLRLDEGLRIVIERDFVARAV